LDIPYDIFDASTLVKISNRQNFLLAAELAQWKNSKWHCTITIQQVKGRKSKLTRP
jgi:hypothetical protein